MDAKENGFKEEPSLDSKDRLMRAIELGRDAGGEHGG